RDLPVMGILTRIFLDPPDQLRRADLIGIIKWSASMAGETIAEQEHRIDIDGPLGNALLDDAGGLGNHRRHVAGHDLFVAEFAGCDALLCPLALDDLHDIRIRCAIAGIVIEIIAFPGLAPEPALFTYAVGNPDIAFFRRAGRRLAFPRRPADIHSGQIGNGKWPHGKSEILERMVDLLE